MKIFVLSLVLGIECVASFFSCQTVFAREVEQWEIFELSFTGSESGNPFSDMQLSAVFYQQADTFHVKGFYDGNGTWKIRFMPDRIGKWKYVTSSNHKKFNGIKGTFVCLEPTIGNNGPVRVRNTFHFAYANGEAFLPVGTTCYAWVHQSEDLQEQTLETLKNSPFNKLRMTVFPKYYPFNRREPRLYPYQKDTNGNWDFSRFNPEFFQHIEKRIADLKQAGIEADLILFHPYDKGHWGFDQMTMEQNQRYLEYVIARFAAFRNVWWSMANEYDLMENFSLDAWDSLFQVIQTNDPYHKLTSIHNGSMDAFYDHTKPYITHVSLQHFDMKLAPEWKKYNKPVINDECEYEGNLWFPWGNLTAEELVHRAWTGYGYGIYVGHGETYTGDSENIWWSHGGELHGMSPERFKFLKKVMYETAPEGLMTFDAGSWLWPRFPGTKGKGVYMYYFGDRQPATWNFYQGEEGVEYQAEVIDTWNMTIKSLKGRFKKGEHIPLPQKPRIALRIREIDQ